MQVKWLGAEHAITELRQSAFVQGGGGLRHFERKGSICRAARIRRSATAELQRGRARFRNMRERLPNSTRHATLPPRSERATMRGHLPGMAPASCCTVRSRCRSICVEHALTEMTAKDTETVQIQSTLISWVTAAGCGYPVRLANLSKVAYQCFLLLQCGSSAVYRFPICFLLGSRRRIWDVQHSKQGSYQQLQSLEFSRLRSRSTRPVRQSPSPAIASHPTADRQRRQATQLN